MSSGELLSIFKAAACVFASVAVLVRLPRVVQQGRPDFVWVGTALAAVAFSANGVMVPDRTVDAWLGGDNAFHLVRNLLALSAMWCLRAALVQSLQRTAWSRVRTLGEAAVGVALLSALTIAFWEIDRGPTSGSFIPDHLDQGATLVYTLLIMVMGGWNAADVARVAFRELTVRQSGRDRLLWPALLGLGAGGALLVAGCALEAVYAVLDHLGTWEPVGEAMRSSFGPVFLPGAALVCLTVAWLGLYAQGQRLKVGVRMDLLRIAPVWERVGAERWGTGDPPPGWRSALSANPQRVLYSSVIAIEDTLRADEVTLPRDQRRALVAAERRFELTP
ncbi:hypothetical protein ACH9EU_08390 [Kocuria sp. M1R5S2]|uniref:hypothetical protein n=1 Tax=Kocuria rhizosphaerae TaxID=3376285 RepID=UPI0037B30A4F